MRYFIGTGDKMARIRLRKANYNDTTVIIEQITGTGTLKKLGEISINQLKELIQNDSLDYIESE